MHGEENRKIGRHIIKFGGMYCMVGQVVRVKQHSDDKLMPALVLYLPNNPRSTTPTNNIDLLPDKVY
jgi:hypothetical protein